MIPSVYLPKIVNSIKKIMYAEYFIVNTGNTKHTTNGFEVQSPKSATSSVKGDCSQPMHDDSGSLSDVLHSVV